MMKCLGKKLGTTEVMEHRIPTTDDIPVSSKPYRLPHALKQELDEQLQEMLESDIIEHSNSNYCNNVFLVGKKPDQGNKKYRMVVDFRQLNEKTVRDKYPLPNIMDILDQAGQSKYYSTFDLAQGFFKFRCSKVTDTKRRFLPPLDFFSSNECPWAYPTARPHFKES